MRPRSATLCLTSIALLLAGVLAQDAAPELPSAPSAAKQSSNKPKPAPPKPAEPPKESKPAPSAESTPADAAKQKTSANGSSNVNSDDDPAATIRSFVNEVNVVFTVTDKRGRFVKDLEKADFKVVDDGKPAEQVRSFQRQTDLPLQVGLLVDASNSVRDRFKFEQESAIEFLSQTVRPRYDKAFVVGFDVTPEVTQDFTDNTENLSKGVRLLRPGGGTAMFDALYYACRDKLGKQPRTGPLRRAIVLLSDGDDNQSHVTREEAIEMAQRVEAIVYTISTNVTGSGGRGDKVLQRIADATGGRAFFPFQITDVANAFSEIQDELRSQYALSYTPADFRLDGRYRSIQILAQNKKLKVRTRNGYYAPTAR
jgi:Ca-activated chloride channel homolog